MRPSFVPVLVICAITALAFIGISAYSDQESSTLQLFVGVMSPVVATLLLGLKQDKTTATVESTDKKVNDRFDGLEERVEQIERSLMRILSKLP